MLTETKQFSHTMLPTIPGYIRLGDARDARSDSHIAGMGGVAVWVKEKWALTGIIERIHDSQQHDNILWLRLTTDTAQPAYLAIVYNRPGQKVEHEANMATLISTTENIRSQPGNSDIKLVIAGDFNTWLPQVNQTTNIHPYYPAFKELQTKLGLHVLTSNQTNSATFRGHQGSSTPDHVITSHPNLHPRESHPKQHQSPPAPGLTVHPEISCGSDHRLITFLWNINPPSKHNGWGGGNPSKWKNRTWTKTQIDYYQKYLSKSDDLIQIACAIDAMTKDNKKPNEHKLAAICEKLFLLLGNITNRTFTATDAAKNKDPEGPALEHILSRPEELADMLSSMEESDSLEFLFPTNHSNKSVQFTPNRNKIKSELEALRHKAESKLESKLSHTRQAELRHIIIRINGILHEQFVQEQNDNYHEWWGKLIHATEHNEMDKYWKTINGILDASKGQLPTRMQDRKGNWLTTRADILEEAISHYERVSLGTDDEAILHNPYELCISTYGYQR
jgi:hypothetical protein